MEFVDPRHGYLSNQILACREHFSEYHNFWRFAVVKVRLFLYAIPIVCKIHFEVCLKFKLTKWYNSVMLY